MRISGNVNGPRPLASRGSYSALRPGMIGPVSVRKFRLYTLLVAAVMLGLLFENTVISQVPFLRTPFAMIVAVLFLFFILNEPLKSLLRKGPFLVAILLCVYGAIVSILYALMNIDASLWLIFMYYMSYVQSILLFVVLAEIVRKYGNAALVWASFMLFALVVGILGLLGFDQLDLVGVQQRGGFEEINLNRQAFLFALCMLTIIFVAIDGGRELVRNKMLFAFAISAFLVFLTMFLFAASRGVFLAFLAALFFLLISNFRMKNLSSLILLGVPLIAFLVYGLLESGLLINRLMRSVQGQDLGHRDTLLAAAFALSRESPWIGHSYTYFQTLGVTVFGPDRRIDAHNGIFQLVLMFGYPFLVLWFYFLWTIGRRLWVYRHFSFGRFSLALFIFNISFMFIGSVASNLYFWITLAIASNAHLVRDDVLGALRMQWRIFSTGQIPAATRMA